jgi:hypothetical protein
MRPEHLATDQAFDRFLRGFEEGTLPKTEWTHGAHVATAACYLHGSSYEAVLPLMRQRIRAYNEAVGGQNTPTAGYHETLTRFWLLVIAALLHECQPETPLAAAQLAVATYGEERALHSRYYSWDVVRDSAARLGWREPDLIPPPAAQHPLD